MATHPDLYNSKPAGIVFYSATWCPDCKRSKAVLDTNGVNYLNVDIGKDNDAFLFVEKLTRRVRIPTIIFPDGTIMIEPEDKDLLKKITSK
jgi:mycoredoxin